MLVSNRTEVPTFLDETDETGRSYVVVALAFVPWILYSIQLTIFLLSIVHGYTRLMLHRTRDSGPLTAYLPGVTIIKPLMGVDPLLMSNLESHFNIEYPKLEILMCVADQTDPAVELVERLQAAYPHVDCRLFIGGRYGIINPMVRNCCPAYDAAKYDIVWISTSRIKASSEILLDMVTKLTSSNGIGLVHQMPFTTDGYGLAAAVEKIHFGANIAKYYLVGDVINLRCIVGMSYLVRRSHLEEVKGLAFFGRYLAEDYFLAKYLVGRGFRNRVASIPAQQNVAAVSLAEYKDRMVRWWKLRLNMMTPVSAIVEPLGESIPLGIYASWAAWYSFGFSPYVWFIGHWIVWMTLDFTQLRRVQNRPLPFSFPVYVLSWIVHEILDVWIFIEAILDARRISWGGRTYYQSDFGRSIRIVNN